MIRVFETFLRKRNFFAEPEPATEMDVFKKMMFLKILQNSQLLESLF